LERDESSRVPGTRSINLATASFAQAVVPPALLGRYQASIHFIGVGVLPFGALACGVLGAATGLRFTLALASSGIMTGFLWTFFSPLRSIRQFPLPEV
jgi:hypothetical protein